MRQYYLTFKAMSPVPIAGRISSRLIRSFDIEGDNFYAADGADDTVSSQRKNALENLSQEFKTKFAKSINLGNEVLQGLSDLRFTDNSRVPFPFQKFIRNMLPLGSFIEKSFGPRIKDIDGNVFLDIGGSYSVNLCGVDKYREFVSNSMNKTKEVGMVLGPLHTVVSEVIEKLKFVSGQDEVSFHMSGTEAVMTAVRLACFNTRRKYVVVFGGAYHGWWDGVQPGVGNERSVTDVITLTDMSDASLVAIKSRAHQIACVLINPIQGFNPNSPPPSDLVMLNSNMRKSRTNMGVNDKYRLWLHKLRDVCTNKDIPLIFDEVYSGFRMGIRGGQEFYDIKADMIVYGKTLGGGLPIGVVCGKKELMRRFDPRHPLRIAYVVGTFSASPIVLGAMSEFLKWALEPSTKVLMTNFQNIFNNWIVETNGLLEKENYPIRLNNLTTIWTIAYTQPSRYNWMLQYYMRSEGISLLWVGTGRLLMSLDFTLEDFTELQNKLIRAAKRMKNDGWWWCGKETKPLTSATISSQITKEIIRNTILKKIKDSVLNDILALPVNEGVRAIKTKPPSSVFEFYKEIMVRKHHDHLASHSNTVNQFLHFISSSIFLYCYAIAPFNMASAMSWGIFSLALRQSGHAIFEPPCHDEEELLLGFNTKSKCFVFASYVLAPLLSINTINKGNTYDIMQSIANSWFGVTCFYVFGHTALLSIQYGFTISMVWLIKLVTDPITDINAYYKSLFSVWTSQDWKTGSLKTFTSHWNKEGKQH